MWSDVYGQYVRTYPDGTKIKFAGKDAGTMTGVSDRFGRTTAIAWRNTWETHNPVPVLSTITDPAGKVTTFGYHNGVYLKDIVDPAGRTASFSLTSGDLKQISGPTNLTLTYDSQHRVASYTDSNGKWDLAYDTRGTVRQLTSPAVMASGQSVRLTTTQQTLHAVTVLEPGQTSLCCNWAAPVPSDKVYTSVADPLGHTTKQSLDRYGNVTRLVDPLGRAGNVYNEAGLPESVNAGDQGIESTWNSNGRLVSRSVNGTSMYSASYGLDGQVEYEFSGGDERWFSYRDRGELKKTWTGKQEDENETATTYEYSADYFLKAANGPSGQRMEWDYDSTWMNVSAVRVQRDDGSKLATSFEYDQPGRQKTATDPLNQTTTVSYDTGNRPLQITDSRGQTVKYGYTGDHLTSVTDPANKTYGYSYNAIGWLLAETFPEDNTSRSYSYNSDGQLLSSTDRRGRTVSATYDDAHRLVTRTADGVATRFEYPDGNTTIFINNESKVTVRHHAITGGPDLVRATLGGPESIRYYEIGTIYDESSWANKGIDIRQYHNGLLRTESIRYTYDPRPTDPAFGSALEIEDLSGRKVMLSYDPEGRHARTTFPNGVTQSNTYRTEGGLLGREFSSAAVNNVLGARYAYDSILRVTERTNVAGDLRWTYEPDYQG